MSWNMINTMGNPQVNSFSEAAGSRSRPTKRQEVARNPGPSKSQRRSSRESRTTEVPLAADQRLDILMRESANRIQGRQESSRVEFVIGSRR